MAIDPRYFKEKLEKEKTNLEREMAHVGRRNPDSPSDWEAVPSSRDTSQADENTVADSIEEYGENEAILTTLENRYQDVLSGLNKIKDKTYGTCQVCGAEIDAERLEANPAARTCRLHMS